MKFLIVFLVSILLVGGVLVYTYFSISNTPSIQKENIIIEKLKKPVKKTEEKLKIYNYFNLPAREIYMKLDFKRYQQVTIYKLIISVKDGYKAFNIKRVLDSYSVAFSVLENKNIEIYAFFNSIDKANRVFKRLKEYNLSVKIEKLVQRI